LEQDNRLAPGLCQPVQTVRGDGATIQRLDDIDVAMPCGLEYETRFSDHVGTGHNDRAHRPLINEAPEVVDGAVATNQRRQPTCRL
jgi:hypothetical protein